MIANKRNSQLTAIGVALGLGLASLPAFAGDWETIYPGGETSCANGEDYRFSVRRASADKAMIYFNGGGACWNGHMCDPANSSSDMNKGMIYRTQPTAEYGNHPGVHDGAFALDNEENPFKDWTQVFVTYCTGDVHLGERIPSTRKTMAPNLRFATGVGQIPRLCWIMSARTFPL